MAALEKKVSYKGVKAIKPDNLSMNLFKKVVNECGNDYCITVQSVLNIISEVLKHQVCTSDKRLCGNQF